MSRPAIVGLLAICLLGSPVAAALGEEGMTPPDHTVESTILDQGSAPLLDLAYSWSEGQAESLVVDVWEARVVLADGRLASEQPGLSVRVEATVIVESVAADGSAIISTIVDAVSLLDPTLVAESEKLLADLETLPGLRLREHIDDKGYLLASETFDPEPDLEDAHPIRDAAKSSLEHLATRLPLEPIGSGGRWQEVVVGSDDQMGVTETATIRKTLTSMEGTSVLHISAESLVSVPQQETLTLDWPFDDGATVSMDGGAEATMRVDLERAAQAMSGIRRGSASMTSTTDEDLRFEIVAAAGIASAPGGWSDASWPQLPPVIAIEVPPAGPAAATVEAAEAAEPRLGVVVLDAGAEPREALRYVWHEGQTEDFAMEMRLGMRVLMDGEWTPWVGVPATAMAGTYTVTAVNSDGTYDVHALYTDVRIPSGSATLPPETLEQMEAQLSSLMGTSQVLRVDDRGRVLSSQTSLPPGAMTDALQPGQLDSMTEEFVEPLPAEPVGEGAVWEVQKWSSDAMGFATHGTTTSRLVEIDGGRLHLEGEMSMAADPQPMISAQLPAYVEATIDVFDLEGELTKTIDLGLVGVEASSRAIAAYAFTTTIAKESQRTQMEMSLEMDAWLVDPRPDTPVDE